MLSLPCRLRPCLHCGGKQHVESKGVLDFCFVLLISVVLFFLKMRFVWWYSLQVCPFSLLLKTHTWWLPGGPVGKTLLPVQGAWVRSLAGELRSRMPCSKKIFLNTRYSHVLSGLPVSDTEPDTPRTLSCLRQTTEHQRQGCRGLNPSLALFNLCVLAKFA